MRRLAAVLISSTNYKTLGGSKNAVRSDTAETSIHVLYASPFQMYFEGPRT